MKVASIVLTDQNNAIGKNHIILKYLPAFVNYFEELTKGSPVISSQRTFENICHILKSKKNIVITKNEKYHSTKAKTYQSLQDALIACKKREKAVFVIGGSEIYRKAMPHTTEIYRACITARIKSAQYYPEIDAEEFELESAECISADARNRFDYCIEKWVRTNGAD